MVDLNSLTAYRAIVDNEGKPLPEFLLMWQDMANRVNAATARRLYSYVEYLQQADVATIYAAGLAQVTANQAIAAGGGTVRSGIDLNFVATTGSTWVSAGTETLSTVSAGDLTILNSGPIQSLYADGVTEGEWRIVEDPSGTPVVMFTGSWRADGDGASYSLVQNLDVETTLSFSNARSSTGTVEYGMEVRVTSGLDVTLLTYMFVQRA